MLLKASDTHTSNTKIRAIKQVPPGDMQRQDFLSLLTQKALSFLELSILLELQIFFSILGVVWGNSQQISREFHRLIFTRYAAPQSL